MNLSGLSTRTDVMDALADAFAQGGAMAAALGVEGETASVAVLVPGLESLSSLLPPVAPARFTIRSVTRARATEVYTQMVFDRVLDAARRAFAAAPGLSELRLVAVRRVEGDRDHAERTEAVLAARLSRSAVESGRSLDASSEGVLLNRHPKTKALLPLPELESALDQLRG